MCFQIFKFVEIPSFFEARPQNCELVVKAICYRDINNYMLCFDGPRSQKVLPSTVYSIMQISTLFSLYELTLNPPEILWINFKALHEI